MAAPALDIQTSSPIDLSHRPMSAFQWLMVAICFILNFNDGIDVLIVSFSSTAIIAEWGLSKVEMGYVFSAGLAGMTLGCFLIAPLADRRGRRAIFLVSVGVIALGMLGVGLCHNYGLLLALRFLTGLGIGGILPTMAATAAEFSNQKYRDINVGLVQAGWPIGAILTGLFCANYIPVYGWHSAFLVAGGLAVVMWLLVLFFMTDSLDFMLNQRTASGQSARTLTAVNRLLARMNADPIAALPTVQRDAPQPGLPALLGTTYKRNTLTVWVGAFFGFMTLYTLMSWVPTIAKDAGLPFALATGVGIMLNVGAALGSASIGAFGSRFGLRQSVLTFMLVAFAVMQVYAFTPLTPTLIFGLVLLIGFFVQGGFNGIWPTLSRLYPAGIRATGVGYTVGIGRLGAILGPLLFGYLSDGGVSIQTLFVLFSLPLLVMGCCIWSLRSGQL
ncbi:MFS transporter [Spirosoma rhododendri]|uniref:MFS transporter n=1 Tax=Spirosoma rhododendri TaxID=2728024 RepID=A0A7L5DNK5_9BACT|nr:MFS transporter [Spirosoma rhododendri]QJD79986.1 MFS transporter [Spirosoma rhododendri]